MSKHIHCFKCGAELSKADAIPFKHSTGTRYTCRTCAAHCGAYSWENHSTQGAETAQGFTMSKEFEIPRAALRYINAAETVAYKVYVSVLNRHRAAESINALFDGEN